MCRRKSRPPSARRAGVSLAAPSRAAPVRVRAQSSPRKPSDWTIWARTRQLTAKRRLASRPAAGHSTSGSIESIESLTASCLDPPAAGAARRPTRSSTARSVGTMSTAARRRQIAPASAVSARAQNTNKLAAARAGTPALLKSLTKRHGQIPYTKKWVLLKSVLLTGEMGTPGIT